MVFMVDIQLLGGEVERGAEILTPAALRVVAGLQARQTVCETGGGPAMEALFSTYPSWAIAVVRVVLGIVFFAHGAQKVPSSAGRPERP